MLEAAQYDTAKLVNAVQASLNSAKQTEEKSSRGNVKLVSKEVDFRFTESTQAQYLGKTDAPAKFARWHDSMARHFKVCGEPSGELTVDVLPVSLKTWLDDKFSLTAKVAGNGPVRKGSIKSVPTPAVPA
jgi:hypothetical protein